MVSAHTCKYTLHHITSRPAETEHVPCMSRHAEHQKAKGGPTRNVQDSRPYCGEGWGLTSRPSSLSIYSVTTLWRLPCSALALRKASVSLSPDSPVAFSRSRSSRR